jgi:hypothetical protein
LGHPPTAAILPHHRENFFFSRRALPSGFCSFPRQRSDAEVIRRPGALHLPDTSSPILPIEASQGLSSECDMADKEVRPKKRRRDADSEPGTPRKEKKQKKSEEKKSEEKSPEMRPGEDGLAVGAERKRKKRKDRDPEASQSLVNGYTQQPGIAALSPPATDEPSTQDKEKKKIRKEKKESRKEKKERGNEKKKKGKQKESTPAESLPQEAGAEAACAFFSCGPHPHPVANPHATSNPPRNPPPRPSRPARSHCSADHPALDPHVAQGLQRAHHVGD